MNRPVSDLANCTNKILRQATRLMTQAFDAELHSTGLKATQFTLLATLQKLGESPLSKLAEALVMDRTTLTRNLRPLLDQDLVQQTGSEQDQRVKQIRLTLQGKQRLDIAIPQWQKIQHRFVERLGEKRWARFIKDLETTVEIVKEMK